MLVLLITPAAGCNDTVCHVFHSASDLVLRRSLARPDPDNFGIPRATTKRRICLLFSRTLHCRVCICRQTIVLKAFEPTLKCLAEGNCDGWQNHGGRVYGLLQQFKDCSSAFPGVPARLDLNPRFDHSGMTPAQDTNSRVS